MDSVDGPCPIVQTMEVVGQSKWVDDSGEASGSKPIVVISTV